MTDFLVSNIKSEIKDQAKVALNSKLLPRTFSSRKGLQQVRNCKQPAPKNGEPSPPGGCTGPG